MTWLKRGLWVLLMLAVLWGGYLLLLPKPIGVETLAARRGTFVQSVENEGKTRIRDRYTVSAPLAGTLSRIGMKVGDQVAQDEVLAVVAPALAPLDDPRTHRQLEERLGVAEAYKLRAAASVARVEARLDQAKTDLARAETLASSGVVSAKRREDETLNVRVLNRELEAAQFDSHMADHLIDLARAALGTGGEGTGKVAPIEIRSPINGVVTKVVQESEGPIALGGPIVELGDPRQLEVVADLLTTDAVQIAPGAAATIERWGGPTSLEARVRRIEPAAFTKVSALGIDEQRVNVDIDILSPRDQWKTLGDAFRVEVRIEICRLDDALIVPANALFKDANGWSLFVVENGRARRRSVNVIRRGGLDAAIAGGIEAGAPAILFPPETLKDGDRVELKPGMPPGRTGIGQ